MAFFWEQRKLQSVIEDYAKKTTVENQYPVLTSSQQLGIVLQDDYFAGDRVSKSGNIGYYILPKGYFAYRSRSDNDVFVFNRNDCIDIGIISYFYPVFRPHMVDSDFLLIRLNYGLERQIKIASEGTGQHVLSLKKFKNMIALFPNKVEQQKIGSLFSKLDHLITLHQCKHFTNCNKNRFAWEQRKFGEIVIIERGGSPRPIDKFITDDESGLNWVKIGDAPKSGNYITNTKEKIITEGLSKTREVYPGDLILSNSMSFGKPYIMGIKGCIHDGWLLIRDSNNEFDLMYLCYMLGTDTMLYQYKAMAAGSTVNNLNKELVGNTYVKYPSMLEQEQIGSFFSKLDHLITLHQSKCDNLKEVKKYMLQNMFI